MLEIVILAALASPFLFLAFVLFVHVTGTRAIAKRYKALESKYGHEGFRDFSKAWVSPANGKLYRYNIRTGMIVRAPDNAPRMCA